MLDLILRVTGSRRWSRRCSPRVATRIASTSAERASSCRCRSAARDRARPRSGAAAGDSRQLRAAPRRRANPWRTGAARLPAPVPVGADRPPGREAERAALRGAGRSSGSARPAAQVLVLSLAQRGRVSRRGGGRDARAHCTRAGVEDGMEILDLGCGWGSLTFWLAERYPAARVLAVSNSGSSASGSWPRREAAVSRDRGQDGRHQRLRARSPLRRVLSIEMMEHMRNYPELLRRVGSWLEPDGRLFVHVFSHRRFAYPFRSGWMARNSSRRGRCRRTTCSPRSPTGSHWRSARP